MSGSVAKQVLNDTVGTLNAIASGMQPALRRYKGVPYRARYVDGVRYWELLLGVSPVQSAAYLPTVRYLKHYVDHVMKRG